MKFEGETAYPILNSTTNFTTIDDLISEEELLYDVPVSLIILLSIFYGTISILAVVGNSLVIWIVLTTKQMQTITNMFIANLALADVTIGLFVIPFQFQAALLQRWNLPNFMCPFCPFVQLISVNVSVFTLTAIAVDRHRAIINPLRPRTSKKISKFTIAVIWMISFCLAAPFLYALRVVSISHITINSENNSTYSNITVPFCEAVNFGKAELLLYRYILVFVQYFIPLCVISFVYIQMAFRLWGSKTPGNAQDARDITMLRNKKKVIKMLIIVVALFASCWFPLQLYNILYVTYPEINSYRYINIIWFTCDWLAMSNSCYNPFIYGIYNEKFKREFRKRFALKKFHNYQEGDKTLSMLTRVSSLRSTTSIRNRVNTTNIIQKTSNRNPYGGDCERLKTFKSLNNKTDCKYNNLLWETKLCNPYNSQNNPEDNRFKKSSSDLNNYANAFEDGIEDAEIPDYGRGLACSSQKQNMNNSTNNISNNTECTKATAHLYTKLDNRGSLI